MQIENIPGTLKECARWCVWRFEGRERKQTKVPYNPMTGTHARANDPETFASFGEALAGYEKGGYDGLGIGLFDDLAAVDIDHCIDEAGQLSPIAADVIERMNSYTERSPSGTGVRIVFRAPSFERDTTKYYSKNPHNGLEIYVAGSTSRFVTITGDTLKTAENVEARPQELNDVLDIYMLRPQSEQCERSDDTVFLTPDLTDDEIIERAGNATNGDMFKMLWKGDTSAYNGDDSAADLALCNHLAFWCRSNEEQMDRLFRRSALIRSKWDERRGDMTYGEMTIRKAVADCSRVYNPLPRQIAEQSSLKPADFTDTGNADVFARAYKGYAIYVKSIGWLVWDGKRWLESDTHVRLLAMRLTSLMLEEATAELQASGDVLTEASVMGHRANEASAKNRIKAAEAYRKHVIASRSRTRTDNMTELARPLLEVDPKRLDACPYTLNTPAGLVDLKTGAIRPHDPDAFCTKITLCSPGARGQEMWSDFLAAVTGCNVAVAGFLQQIAGMSAVGKVFEENLIMVLGEGANGKSTFFNALRAVFGEYADGLAAEVLTTSNKSKGAELATLKGKRLVIAAELEEGMRLSASMLKQITSTDAIRAERKYKDPESFTPSHTTVLYTNYLPRVGSMDNGTWRRLLLVPFKVKFDRRNVVKNFADKLTTEAGEAILSWVIAGAQQFIAANHTLAIPDVVQGAVAEYKDENDWLRMFLDDCCELGPGKLVGANALYDEYVHWVSQNNEYLRSKRDFKTELLRRGYSSTRTNRGIIWNGLCAKMFDVA